MSKSENMPSLPMWEGTETLRVTGFLKEQIDIPHDDWWMTVTGGLPEQITTHPNKGETRAEANYENSKLLYTKTAVAVEWRMIPPELESSPAFHLATLGQFSEVFALFQEISHKWLTMPTLPMIGRLAFGATLFIPVENVAQGYTILDDYLPDVRLDPENSSDFFYQINRQRSSKINSAELQINRISRWAVMSRQNVLILPAIREGETLHAVRLDLDINTVQGYERSLNELGLEFLFDELVGLAKEIAEKGDV